MQMSVHMMMMMMLLAGKTQAARGPLFFFFEHGIIGKVSKGFLENLVGNIAELMSDRMQVRYLTLMKLKVFINEQRITEFLSQLRYVSC